MRPGGFGMRRMMLRAVTDLPQPDSPTTPIVCPDATSKETSSTARTVPCSVRNSVTSPEISRIRSSAFGRLSAWACAIAPDHSTRPAAGSGGWNRLRRRCRDRWPFLSAHAQPGRDRDLELAGWLRRPVDDPVGPLDHQVGLLLRLNEL